MFLIGGWIPLSKAGALTGAIAAAARYWWVPPPPTETSPALSKLGRAWDPGPEGCRSPSQDQTVGSSWELLRYSGRKTQ